jgi:hypothetical protein
MRIRDYKLQDDYGARMIKRGFLIAWLLITLSFALSASRDCNKPANESKEVSGTP